MKIAIFVDYDNLSGAQKASGILDIATKTLLQTSLPAGIARGSCDIRIYGGWYEGPTMTQRAQELAVAVGTDFPAIIRVPRHGGGVVGLAANAELAMAMMEEPSHHLFDTYRKKGKPANLRVQSPLEVGCQDEACPLPLARKLLKKGKCPIACCQITADDLVYRHEQKIVDTMLACDMVYAPTLDYEHLILVSGDDDFLPPLRTVLLRGVPVSRFHPKPNSLRASLVIRGMKLTETDL